MGVPTFYRWLCCRYPRVVVDVGEGHVEHMREEMRLRKQQRRARRRAAAAEERTLRSSSSRSSENAGAGSGDSAAGAARDSAAGPAADSTAGAAAGDSTAGARGDSAVETAVPAGTKETGEAEETETGREQRMEEKEEETTKDEQQQSRSSSKCEGKEQSTSVEMQETEDEQENDEEESFAYDCLYLDMNGIIHPCCHTDDGGGPATEEEMFLCIFQYIDRIVELIQPRQLLYMAIDGVAPRAKMNQQRSRRFKTAKDIADEERAYEEIKEQFLSEGRDVPPKKVKWDSNVITPGTPFMHRLSLALTYYIQDRIATRETWKNFKVIFSDATVPGEGEHKIMDFIRQQRKSSSYQPNLWHVLHGADADLIMLGLATHERNFCILREAVVERTAAAAVSTSCSACGAVGHSADACPFSSSETAAAAAKTLAAAMQQGNTKKHLRLDSDAWDSQLEQHRRSWKPLQMLQLPVLREYLQYELITARGPEAAAENLERCIDDFVFLCFLCGNDFLPHLPHQSIQRGSIDALVELYIHLRPHTLTDYLTNEGTVNYAQLKVFLQYLSVIEEEVIRRDLQRKSRIREKNAQERQQQQHKDLRDAARAACVKVQQEQQKKQQQENRPTAKPEKVEAADEQQMVNGSPANGGSCSMSNTCAAQLLKGLLGQRGKNEAAAARAETAAEAAVAGEGAAADEAAVEGTPADGTAAEGAAAEEAAAEGTAGGGAAAGAAATCSGSTSVHTQDMSNGAAAPETGTTEAVADDIAAAVGDSAAADGDSAAAAGDSAAAAGDSEAAAAAVSDACCSNSSTSEEIGAAAETAATADVGQRSAVAASDAETSRRTGEREAAGLLLTDSKGEGVDSHKERGDEASVSSSGGSPPPSKRARVLRKKAAGAQQRQQQQVVESGAEQQMEEKKEEIDRVKEELLEEEEVDEAQGTRKSTKEEDFDLFKMKLTERLGSTREVDGNLLLQDAVEGGVGCHGRSSWRLLYYQHKFHLPSATGTAAATGAAAGAVAAAAGVAAAGGVSSQQCRRSESSMEAAAAAGEVDILAGDVARMYLIGLQWVLYYYYQGCRSFDWFYPFHYAPLAVDLAVELQRQYSAHAAAATKQQQQQASSHSSSSSSASSDDALSPTRDATSSHSDSTTATKHDTFFKVQFNSGEPFSAFEQLMAVLPPYSAGCMPVAHAELMRDPLSSIADFYPLDVEMDPNGKRYQWQWVVLLPFIDEERLLKKCKVLEETLTSEERMRNRRGLDQLYVHRSHPLATVLSAVHRAGAVAQDSTTTSSEATAAAADSDSLQVKDRETAAQQESETAKEERDGLHIPAEKGHGFTGKLLFNPFGVQSGQPLDSPIHGLPRLDSAAFCCLYTPLNLQQPHRSVMLEGAKPYEAVLDKIDLQDMERRDRSFSGAVARRIVMHTLQLNYRNNGSNAHGRNNAAGFPLYRGRDGYSRGPLLRYMPDVAGVPCDGATGAYFPGAGAVVRPPPQHSGAHTMPPLLPLPAHMGGADTRGGGGLRSNFYIPPAAAADPRLLGLPPRAPVCYSRAGPQQYPMNPPPLYQQQRQGRQQWHMPPQHHPLLPCPSPGQEAAGGWRAPPDARRGMSHPIPDGADDAQAAGFWRGTGTVVAAGRGLDISMGKQAQSRGGGGWDGRQPQVSSCRGVLGAPPSNYSAYDVSGGPQQRSQQQPGLLAWGGGTAPASNMLPGDPWMQQYAASAFAGAAYGSQAMPPQQQLQQQMQFGRMQGAAGGSQQQQAHMWDMKPRIDGAGGWWSAAAPASQRGAPTWRRSSAEAGARYGAMSPR